MKPLKHMKYLFAVGHEHTTTVVHTAASLNNDKCHGTTQQALQKREQSYGSYQQQYGVDEFCIF